MTFETATCPRCLGSGRYSYNSMNGDMCFGCSGKGICLTKRGRAARDHMIELQKRPVRDMRPGDYFWNLTRWVKILAIEEYPYPAKSLQPDGTWKEYRQVTLVAARPQDGLTTQPEAILRSVRNEAHRREIIAAALAYQATLTKAGKPAKAA